MLVLERKTSETVELRQAGRLLGCVMVVEIRDDRTARLGFDFLPEIDIVRPEAVVKTPRKRRMP